MKKFLNFFVLAGVLAIVATSCYKVDLENLQKQNDALINRIQSIAVIPSYSDGIVKVGSCGNVDTISFDVKPAAAAQSLADAWKEASTEARTSMVSFKIKEVQTKGMVLPTALIDTVFFNDAELKVGVKLENLPDNAMTSIVVSSGKSDLSSGYFPLNVVDLTGQHGVLNGQEYVLIKAKYNGIDSTYLKWATQNLAVTESGKSKWMSTNYQIGDYFQWAAYDGYVSGTKPENLVIYTSFTNTCAGGSSNSFTFKTGKTNGFKKDSNAPYCDGTNYTKYTGTGEGNDGKTKLELSDDVANIVLGSTWRIPTGGFVSELTAMRAVTYWAWDNTDMGYYVFKPGVGTSGASNGKGNIAETDDKTKALLFFPAAGIVKDTYLDNAGVFGYYWSSTFYSGYQNYAYSLLFNSTYVNPESYYYGRYCGISVRPVSD